MTSNSFRRLAIIAFHSFFLLLSINCPLISWRRWCQLSSLFRFQTSLSLRLTFMQIWGAQSTPIYAAYPRLG